MFYYRILPSKRLPSTFLTYSSSKSLKVGQFVHIALRNSLVIGLVSEQVESVTFETKEISEALPIVLPEVALRYLHLFWFHTLNDYNAIVAVLASWITGLSNKNLLTLKTNFESYDEILVQSADKECLKTKPKLNSNTVAYSIHKEEWLRIRVIIRILIEQQRSASIPQKVLLLVPEVSLLQKYHALLEAEFADQLNLLTFVGDKSLASRTTLVSQLTNTQSLPKPGTNPALTVIVSTRTGIFLPFDSLKQVIVVDEGNSLYIQEQNSVYYDTRDGAYLMSYAHNCPIEFISSLPSVRHAQFDPKAFKAMYSTDLYNPLSSSPRLKVYKRERKDTFYGIFSESILEDIGVAYLED